jgi:hypothetical protein
MALAGSQYAIEAIRETCAAASSEHLFVDLVPLLLKLAPNWTVNMLLERVEHGEPIEDVASDLPVDADPNRIRALAKIVVYDQGATHASRKRFALLCRLSPVVATATVLDVYREALHRDANPSDSPQRSLQRHCEDLLQGTPFPARATCVLALDSFPRDETDVSMFHRLFVSGGAMELREPHDLLAEQVSELRDRVHKGRSVVSPTSEYVRGLRSQLATLLGLFGGPADTEILLAWAREDGAERHRQLAAHEPGATISFTNWYAGAFVRLGTPSAMAALEQLLEEPDYVGAASLGLVALTATDRTNNAPRLWQRPNYREVRDRQKSPVGRPTASEHGERARIQGTIQEAVLRHLDRSDAGGPTPNPYSFGEAARALGELGGVAAVPLLLRLGSRPGCEWGVIDGLEALALQGVELPGRETADIVEPIIRRILTEPAASSQDPWWFGIRCLALLLVSDSPDRGVAQVRRILPSLASHHIRDLMEPLAVARSSAALALLLEMLRGTSPEVLWYPEVIAAVARYPENDVRTALFEVLDEAHGAARRVSYDSWRTLVRVLGTMAREDAGVLATIEARAHEATGSADREILAAILKEVGGDVAALAACDLLRDEAANPIPSAVEQLVEDTVHLRRPLEQHDGWYVVPKPARELRAHLLALTGDSVRRTSARRLLLVIEVSRSETGRPVAEGRYPGRLGTRPPAAIWPLP